MPEVTLFSTNALAGEPMAAGGMSSDMEDSWCIKSVPPVRIFKIHIDNIW
jgi:hypothetical protein